MTTASKAAAFTFSETTLNTVGNGSTFPVYRATHNATNMSLAIKKIPKTDDEREEYIKNEIELNQKVRYTLATNFTILDCFV